MVAFEEGLCTGYILEYFNVTLHALLVYVHIYDERYTDTESHLLTTTHADFVLPSLI